MGYRGKLAEQQRARELRAQAWTLPDIAAELGVSKSSVSKWVRDVDFTPNPRRHNFTKDNPHPLQIAKEREIERYLNEGAAVVGRMTDREFLLVGAALYAGEGFKTGASLGMANTNPAILLAFVAWLRRFFDIDECRLRVRLYLHDGLDLGSAVEFWSQLLEIPRQQFLKPYRAVADASRRRSKHVNGCPAVTYSSSSQFRRAMGLVEAITSEVAFPG
ncbi:helix-turn-helix domain-containing protein [Desertimonas flava]|jgi:transcriptional regulator with XRE-family HTH domain|uniref:helix-turn-helix domain-containing protein n=1 Tax=Desertimonas flava TaxID=2064846 RepID=UPI000E34BF98|nr:helix-turn-helix domain-containing protein [Desertimonas flava]